MFPEGRHRPDEKYRSDGTQKGDMLAWLDARLPLTACWRKYFTGSYVSRNLNVWYLFGILALVLFLIQIVSGIFLAVFYKPDASLNAEGIPIAFASIEFIMREVPWGWLLRYLHSAGASAFFIIIYLHLFRGMLYGSYRKPRELVWVSGMVMLLILMLAAFSGNVLPWGQMSFWSAGVLTGLIESIPLIGQSLASMLRGGDVVGEATLGRFFVIHVMLVPLGIVIMLLMHLISLHEVGPGNPDGVEIYDRLDENGIPADSVPFFPYYFVKDLLAVACFFIPFAAVVFFFPDGGGLLLDTNNLVPADPLKMPEEFNPLWYLSPFYSMMRTMTWNLFWIDARLWGVMVIFGAVLLPALLPWLDKSPVRSIRYRGMIFRIYLALMTCAFVTLGVLGMLGHALWNAWLAGFCMLIYFSYFLTMPWWSKIDKIKPVPDWMRIA